MNSPEPALSPAAAGNLLIVRLEPQIAASALSTPPLAANDGVLAERYLPPAPPRAAPPTGPARVPLIALAAGFWMLGSAILLTLALAARLLG